MLTLFARVIAVFEQNYENRSVDFTSGFLTCYNLFEIAFEKSTQHSARRTLAELEKVRRKLRETERQLKNKTAELEAIKSQAAEYLVPSLVNTSSQEHQEGCAKID